MDGLDWLSGRASWVLPALQRRSMGLSSFLDASHRQGNPGSQANLGRLIHEPWAEQDPDPV